MLQKPVEKCFKSWGIKDIRDLCKSQRCVECGKMLPKTEMVWDIFSQISWSWDKIIGVKTTNISRRGERNSLGVAYVCGW